MKAVQQIIRILVIILIVNHTRCQDGFSDRDILRYQQMAANEGHAEPITVTGYNNIQRDQNQLNTVNVQYRTPDDANEYNRADRTRTRKVYRIKNPFQNQLEEVTGQNEGNADSHDSDTAASNQYASMQYSLPPEEFLQQIRENQYHQQQQQTTPAPNHGYTATPQPQYQYSTISSSNFDNGNQHPNSITQLEPKPHQYINNNGYQFNPQNAFPFDNIQSTPSPATTYLSTALPNSQYVGSSSNYVSSSSPIYLSSPSNLQYVSSPLSNIQTGTPDYHNRITTTLGSSSLNYDSNDHSKKLQIDHYDNSANGIRYPANIPQQYQSEISSTLSPTSVSYSDSRDQWQNNLSPGVNALSKSLQEVSLTQYQSYPYNQQESRSDSTLDTNSDTHRIGGMASANSLYLNFAQPDYQINNHGKTRTRDTEQETGQPEYYSNGEYGWKLSDRKPQTNSEGYSSTTSGNYQRYQPFQNTGQAMSQMTFHMDTSRPNNYEQVSKSATETIEAQEFAKAAANAHEYMKQQQAYYGNNYANSYNTNQGTSFNSNPYYNPVDKQQKQKYTEVSTPAPYIYSSPPDLITASPYYYNSRENNIDNKPKQPFDHAKALKTIVPIDVSNVISNSDSQPKGLGIDPNRFVTQNYGKDQINQNQQQLQQQYHHLSDSYYKDKNSFYGLNIKTRPDDYQSDNVKQFDTNTPYYAKPQQPQEPSYNQGGYSTASQRVNYIPQQNIYENNQSPVNIQQGLQRPLGQIPTDINSILKLNDVPYQLTQSLTPESFRFQNNEFDRGSLPTQLPMKINQDVASHQLDVTSSILNKLLLNKQSFNRPEFEPQPPSIATINGFKVANPFNVDLKLVAEILKGKNPENTNVMSLRDQLTKQTPQKIDLAQLQYLLKNENFGHLTPINEGISPFLEVYNSGRFPYQGVKYSRSQEEEEETIVPIADASSNHPIGAVSDQDDLTHEREASTGEGTVPGDEGVAVNFDEDRSKKSFMAGHRMVRDRHRHPNSLTPSRHSYQRKYPKSDADEPYPLLKPPPPHSGRGRVSNIKLEKHGRRRRVKPRVYKIFKTEALFEAENENENIENSVPTILRPPPPVVESKSDNVEDIVETS